MNEAKPRQRRPQGTGSVFKRNDATHHNKPWVSSIAWTDKDGKKHKKVWYHKTEEEAYHHLNYFVGLRLQEKRPGAVLVSEFLVPRHLTLDGLAQEIGVSPQVLVDLISNDWPMTPNLSIKLARFFGTADEFWMDLQTRYDVARERLRIHEEEAEGEVS